MPANWTTPTTWVTDELVTAAQLNTQIRDNLEYLKSPATVVKSFTGATTTTSTSYVDIDATLAIDLTTSGGDVLVGCTVRYIINSTAGKTIDMRVNVDNTATNDYSLGVLFQGDYKTMTGVFLVTGLTAGLHTFRLQWAALAGGTASLASSGKVHFFTREV